MHVAISGSASSSANRSKTHCDGRQLPVDRSASGVSRYAKQWTPGYARARRTALPALCSPKRPPSPPTRAIPILDSGDVDRDEIVQASIIAPESPRAAIPPARTPPPAANAGIQRAGSAPSPARSRFVALEVRLRQHEQGFSALEVCLRRPSPPTAAEPLPPRKVRLSRSDRGNR